jgi:succinate dehydrogenase/fumarate reductase cytochrome b subunit
MGALHLIQGILMLFLATSVIQKISEFAPTITQNYLTYNTATQSLELTSRDLFQLPFGILVAAFLLISALAHALISLPKKTNDIYNADLEKGINRFRWIEYAFSSSIMIVLISTLFGIYDIASLILIFVVNAVMNLFGLVMEQLNSGKDKTNVNWGPFVGARSPASRVGGHPHLHVRQRQFRACPLVCLGHRRRLLRHLQHPSPST